MIPLAGLSVQWISISYQSGHVSQISPPLEANGSRGTHWSLLSQVLPLEAPPFMISGQSASSSQETPPISSVGFVKAQLEMLTPPELIHSHELGSFCLLPAGSPKSPT